MTQHFPTQVLRQKPKRSCGGRRPETHPLGTNIFSLERGGFGSAPLSTTLGWRRRRVRPSLPSQIDEPAQTSLETNADAGTRGRRFKRRPAGGGNVNSVSVPMVFSRFQERRKGEKKKHQPYGRCSLPVPPYKNKTPPLYYLWHGCLISTKCCRRQ